MSVEKWIAGSGQGLTWGNAFASSGLNSIGSSNALLSGIDISNGTALDVFADVSITLSSAAFAAPNYIGLYLYPLNSDGTTYGDGRFTSSDLGPPPATYFAGQIPIVAATQAQEGICRGIVMPPGTFRFVFYNAGGAALLGSTLNTCQYRTYNRVIA